MGEEIVSSLNIKSNGTYVDATLGYAGMSKKILASLNDEGLLIGIDQDAKARDYAFKELKKVGNNFKILPINFVNMKQALKDLNILQVDGIIFDLGFSSPQIDENERGFSFMSDAPLDMRMNMENSLTAEYLVNTKSASELSEYFFKYGEEKLSKVISQKIVDVRKTKKIKTTLELVEVIKSAVGANYFYKNHPERKIFQALRIAVNNELEVLEKVLPDAISLLKKGGRLSVITFHSGEDRIVKNIFKKYSEVDEIVKGLPDIPKEYQPQIKIINKKPIVPSADELQINSRSHSAKLRIVERI